MNHNQKLLKLLKTLKSGEQGEEEERAHLEGENTDSDLIITMEECKEGKAMRRKAGRKRKRKQTEEDGEEVEIDRRLDQSLESKSKQHNLTTVNVRNILHEVITNEHVVAMMKAAINETEAIPPFEPKMTRSKFKEVVEKGVVIPAWNISPIKKTCEINKPPQFVDIPLAEEDSSDEEYCPDEEEDDETAEDTFQESDMESTASSPRGSRLNRLEDDSCSPWQTSRTRSRCLRLGSGSMGPPPPPKALPLKVATDSTFLEKLHAVEEELAVCIEPFQPLSESEDEAGLMAYRTRSKRPLRDVPLGRLEAELQAPDITPDMYDSGSTPEDREWTDWLRGLMSSDMENEEEGDDEDDPEYNFLADIDEPDLEDYRDDKAVRITKKEVNELMEELFETLKEDLAGQGQADEGHEEETQTPEQQHDIGLGGDGQQDDALTELRTVKQQLAQIRKRQQTNVLCTEPYTLTLDQQQKSRLQQQLQQHVQLLTQIHLLSSPVAKLHSETETTRQFLVELAVLAQRAELLRSPGRPGFCSIFRASNLQGALRLLEELQLTPISYNPQHHPPDARGQMRCFPVMPAELAWLFATRSVFLYPELLPCASLDPALYCPRRTSAFTAAEDCLLVLGLRNMEGSSDPTKLVSQYLLRKTLVQVRRRILQCCRPGFPDNIVKAFRYQRILWPMPVTCSCVDPIDPRPPIEREERVMPLWLVRSLPIIYPTIKHYNSSPDSTPETPPSCRGSRTRHNYLAVLRSACNTYSFPPGTRYPPRVPKHFEFRRIGFVLLQQPPPSLPTPSQKACSPQLHVTRSDSCTAAAPPVFMSTREQIKSHYQTLTSLRRRKYETCPTFPQVEAGNDFVRMRKENKDDEEEEEESDVILALSESSSSPAESIDEDDDLLDSQQKKAPSQEAKTGDSKQREYEGSDAHGEDRVSMDADGEAKESQDDDGDSEDEESEDGEERECEDVAFAQDYLHRVRETQGGSKFKVCDAVQVSPGLSDQLLQVLDQFSAAGPLGAPEALYDSLSSMLQRWPQLLRDFAAFLTREQAARCGLLLEQQLFERSRQFLRRLGQSLGQSSHLYQQVVFVLQGSSHPVPEDIKKISTLLKNYPDLQEEFCEIFQHLQAHLSESCFVSREIFSVSKSPPTGVDCGQQTGKDEKDEKEKNMGPSVKSIKTTAGREKVTWTRDEDRAILTACQQRGASRRTFMQVSAQLGTRTTQQVSLRFHDLMNLFHSTAKTSSSLEGQPINRQEPAPD